MDVTSGNFYLKSHAGFLIALIKRMQIQKIRSRQREDYPISKIADKLLTAVRNRSLLLKTLKYQNTKLCKCERYQVFCRVSHRTFPEDFRLLEKWIAGIPGTGQGVL